MSYREYISKIKELNPIEDVIGERISLNQSGQNYTGLCPFHEDRKPSLSVKAEWGFFKCFGCGIQGDVISFLQEIDDITFKDAIDALAERAGIELYKWLAEEEESFNTERNKQIILQATVEYYQQQLLKEAREYLHSRGLSAEQIEKYRLGWADGGLADYLKQNRYGQHICEQSGVLKNGKDFFNEQIIIPNIINGNVIHITSRSLKDDSPKYVHLAGPIDYLWGEFNFTDKCVVISEGPFDAIALKEWGYDAVALLGTNLKEKHYEHLKKARIVTLLLDGDDAGVKATQLIASRLGANTRIATLPDGKDPADFFRESSREPIDDAIKAAKDFITYQVENISTEITKIELANALAPILKQLVVCDETLIDAHLNETIKNRFRLTNKEIESYKRTIKATRKADKADEPEENNFEQIALLPNIVDICVDSSGNPVFLIIENNKPVICSTLEHEGIYYMPPHRKSMPWLLPRADEVVRYYDELDKDVFQSVESIIRENCDLPHELFYPFLAIWVCHTHLIEKCRFTPIVQFYAVAECGKTRTGKTLLYMSRCGEHVESLREANIIRKAARFETSMFFDVTDIWKKAENKDAEDILLCRYERGITVPRVTRPDAASFEDTEHYKVFGPTIIATNESASHILDSRCIVISMKPSIRNFPDEPTPESLLPMKERLTAMHARWKSKDLPEIDKPAKDRLGDIMKPLCQTMLAIAPDRINDFTALVKLLETSKAESKSLTKEGRLVQAVIDLRDEVIGGIIKTETIVNHMNEAVPDRFHSGSVSIGKMLAALGFEGDRLGDKRGIKYDEEHIDILAIRYGCTFAKSAQSGGTAPSHPNKENTDATTGNASGENPPPVNDRDNTVRADRADWADNQGKPTIKFLNEMLDERCGIRMASGIDKIDAEVMFIEQDLPLYFPNGKLIISPAGWPEYHWSDNGTSEKISLPDIGIAGGTFLRLVEKYSQKGEQDKTNYDNMDDPSFWDSEL